MNRKKTLPIILTLLGLVFLLYGAMYHSQTVRNDKDLDPQPRTESFLVREVTIGGLARTSNGLKQTYNAQSGEGPTLCPT